MKWFSSKRDFFQDQVSPKSAEIKPPQAFTLVFSTSNFDEYSIKNEQASMETLLFHYKSMGYLSDSQEQLTRSKRSVLAEIHNLIQDFVHVFITCKFKKDQININREKVEILIFRCQRTIVPSGRNVC